MRKYDMALKLLPELKPEDFPGDLQDVLNECGEDVARALLRHFSGGIIYISGKWKDTVKQRLIEKHYKEKTVRELQELTGYSETHIYRILRRIKKKSSQ
ncbi:MAG: Mor transcription activator family protein [Nitrospirota bacterium]